MNVVAMVLSVLSISLWVALMFRPRVLAAKGSEAPELCTSADFQHKWGKWGKNSTDIYGSFIHKQYRSCKHCGQTEHRQIKATRP